MIKLYWEDYGDGPVKIHEVVDLPADESTNDFAVHHEVLCKHLFEGTDLPEGYSLTEIGTLKNGDSVSIHGLTITIE